MNGLRTHLNSTDFYTIKFKGKSQNSSAQFRSVYMAFWSLVGKEWVGSAFEPFRYLPATPKRIPKRQNIAADQY